MKATEVNAGLPESNGSLLPGLWRDSLHFTCGLTACTPGSAPGPTVGNEYGKTLPLRGLRRRKVRVQIAAATLSGNSLMQTVHTHCASVHQAAKLVAALLRAAGV